MHLKWKCNKEKEKKMIDHEALTHWLDETDP